MPQKVSHQAYVMSLTAFDRAGQLDEGGFRAHLRRLASAGVGVYVGGSGSGESATYLPGEMKRVLSIAHEELSGKVPLRVNGIEPRVAEQSIEVLDLANDIGYEGAQIFGPDVGHGYKPSTSELRNYFERVLVATKIPVFLMSHQSLGYLVPLSLLEELTSKYDVIRGINVAANDLRYLTEVIALGAARGLPICVGGPDLALNAMALGVEGFLTTEGNLAPRLCVSVVDAFDAADHEQLVTLQRRLLLLSVANARYGNIVGIKAVLRQLKLPGGYARPPRLEIGAAETTQYLEALRSAGVIDAEGLEA
jgi:4-hydroxy-tetrahydrodipicolinate synthase